MKSASRFVWIEWNTLGILLFAFLFNLPCARAGLTIDVHLYHDNIGYYFYPWLNTNAAPPAYPAGNYLVASPGVPASGSTMQYVATSSNLTFVTGGGTYYYDLGSAMQQITNGYWSIYVTNSTSTNQYKFTVHAPNLSSNVFAPVIVTFPADGSLFVASVPTFTWQGPANWAGTLSVVDYFIDATGGYNYETSASLPGNQTNWPSPVVLPNGTNNFNPDYTSNATAVIIASTPTNSSGQAISGWISTATLETYYNANFVVGQLSNPSGGGHTNVAYYSFEDNNLFAHDFSGNGNNIISYGDYSQSPYITNDAAAGSHAFGAAGDGWLYPPTNLLTTLAGSFSVSLWIKTTEVRGNDNDSIYVAAGIVSAMNGGANTVVPMGLTGRKLAFYTGGSAQDTLYSQNNISTGQYVHVVVTRDQQTGEKRIYINGALDTSDFASTDSLSDSSELTIGYNNGQPINGELDDIEFYSGVLSSNEVLQLFHNPGTTVPDVAGGSANGLVAHYDFDEGIAAAPDVSGNGNNIVNASNFGGSGPSTNSDAVAGSGSISFDGGSYLTPTNQVLSTFAGSFTVSLWVNTIQDNGDPYDYAYNGDGIISADVPGVANDLVPVALTGGQIAFNTGNTTGGYDDTINSSATVNDGQWHHVVVSRNQETGEKDIYVDGVLDTSDFDTTNLLNDPQLLTIGAISDASNPDPASPDYNGYNGYQGLLDDVQIYNRVLSSNEVAFLYSNPGTTLGGTTTNTPYPVDVNLQFFITRSQDPNFGEIYGGSVSFNSVNPPPSTTNSVHSPNDYYSTEVYPGGGNGSGVIRYSLGQVINDFTNGVWTIYINQGSPTQQVYTFTMAISGLTTNVLKAVKVFMPTNGAVNISTNPAYYWAGPSNFTTLQVDLLSGPSANLPVTATNWPSASALSYGTNRFDVDYTSNDFAGVVFTTPVDNSATPIRTWSANLNLGSLAFDNFVVGAPAPLPVVLTNIMRSGNNLQFSFQTLAGRPHTIQARTNLVVGSWINLTNFIGDGSLKQFSFPGTNPPTRFFRVSTQ